MKIALVHDWLLGIGGAERVLLELHRIFPKAPIYTLFYNKSFTDCFLPNAEIHSSFIQSIPFHQKIYLWLLPLLPSAVESIDLSGYDTVISSSVTFVKGIVVKPKTKHICYCYSPTRFIWDRQNKYAKERNDNWAVALSQHLMRLWDRSAADRVDQFIAISDTVKKRIKKYYNTEATVIYPPLTRFMDWVKSDDLPESYDYFLIVSRLYEYKNIHAAINAFNKLGQQLVVIGTGPAEKKLRQMARKNINFLGHQDEDTVSKFYRHCRALIIPQEEDFGLTAVEAMSFGRPVIALKKGGVAEIVKEGESGVFFDDAIPEAIADAVRRFNGMKFDPRVIAEQTKVYSRDVFKEKILGLVHSSL